MTSIITQAHLQALKAAQSGEADGPEGSEETAGSEEETASDNSVPADLSNDTVLTTIMGIDVTIGQFRGAFISQSNADGVEPIPSDTIDEVEATITDDIIS